MPPVIGRRTGVDVKAGKNIGKLADGFEDFDHYWSESEPEDSISTWLREKSIISSVPPNRKPLQSLSPFTPTDHNDTDHIIQQATQQRDPPHTTRHCVQSATKSASPDTEGATESDVTNETLAAEDHNHNREQTEPPGDQDTEPPGDQDTEPSGEIKIELPDYEELPPNSQEEYELNLSATLSEHNSERSLQIVSPGSGIKDRHSEPKEQTPENEAPEDKSTHGPGVTQLDHIGNVIGSITRIQAVSVDFPPTEPNSAIQNFKTRKRLTYSALLSEASDNSTDRSPETSQATFKVPGQPPKPSGKDQRRSKPSKTTPKKPRALPAEPLQNRSTRSRQKDGKSPGYTEDPNLEESSEMQQQPKSGPKSSGKTRRKPPNQDTEKYTRSPQITQKQTKQTSQPISSNTTQNSQPVNKDITRYISSPAVRSRQPSDTESDHGPPVKVVTAHSESSLADESQSEVAPVPIVPKSPGVADHDQSDAVSIDTGVTTESEDDRTPLLALRKQVPRKPDLANAGKVKSPGNKGKKSVKAAIKNQEAGCEFNETLEKSVVTNQRRGRPRKQPKDRKEQESTDRVSDRTKQTTAEVRGHPQDEQPDLATDIQEEGVTHRVQETPVTNTRGRKSVRKQTPFKEAQVLEPKRTRGSKRNDTFRSGEVQEKEVVHQELETTTTQGKSKRASKLPVEDTPSDDLSDAEEAGEQEGTEIQAHATTQHQNTATDKQHPLVNDKQTESGDDDFEVVEEPLLVGLKRSSPESLSGRKGTPQKRRTLTHGDDHPSEVPLKSKLTNQQRQLSRVSVSGVNFECLPPTLNFNFDDENESHQEIHEITKKGKQNRSKGKRSNSKSLPLDTALEAKDKTKGKGRKRSFSGKVLHQGNQSQDIGSYHVHAKRGKYPLTENPKPVIRGPTKKSGKVPNAGPRKTPKRKSKTTLVTEPQVSNENQQPENIQALYHSDSTREVPTREEIPESTDGAAKSPEVVPEPTTGEKKSAVEEIPEPTVDQRKSAVEIPDLTLGDENQEPEPIPCNTPKEKKKRARPLKKVPSPTQETEVIQTGAANKSTKRGRQTKKRVKGQSQETAVPVADAGDSDVERAEHSSTTLPVVSEDVEVAAPDAQVAIDDQPGSPDPALLSPIMEDEASSITACIPSPDLSVIHHLQGLDQEEESAMFDEATPPTPALQKGKSPTRRRSSNLSSLGQFWGQPIDINLPKRKSVAIVTPPASARNTPPSSQDTPRSILKRPRSARQSLGTMMGTPLHIYEVTSSNTPQPEPAATKPTKQVKLIVPEQTDDDANLRRSKRTRVPALDWYRNERIKYQPRKSGGFVIAGILSGGDEEHEEVIKSRKRKIAHLAKLKRKPRTRIPQTPRNLSIHEPLPEGVTTAETSDVPVINPITREEVLIDCVVTKDQFRFCNASGETARPDHALVMCKALKQKAFSVGQLVLRAGHEKGTQTVMNDSMVFVIKQGKVAVTIHRTTSILETDDVFFVPQGNTYNIRNLRQDDAKLWFFQHKG